MLRINIQEVIHKSNVTDTATNIVRDFATKFEDHFDTYVTMEKSVLGIDVVNFQCIILTMEEYKELIRRKQENI